MADVEKTPVDPEVDAVQKAFPKRLGPPSPQRDPRPREFYDFVPREAAQGLKLMDRNMPQPVPKMDDEGNPLSDPNMPQPNPMSVKPQAKEISAPEGKTGATTRPAEIVMSNPSFWAMDLKEQRRLLTEKDPRFQRISDDGLTRFLDQMRPKFEHTSGPQMESLFKRSIPMIGMAVGGGAGGAAAGVARGAIEKALPSLLAKAAPFAARVLGSGVGRAAVSPASGEKAGEAFKMGAGEQAVGEVGFAGLRKVLLDPMFIRSFAKRSAGQLADWVKSKVPAWGEYTSDAKGLWEMAHGEGQNRLSESFAEVLHQMKSLIPKDTEMYVHPAEAARMGLRHKVTSEVGADPQTGVPWVAVKVHDAIERVSNARGKGTMSEYHDLLDKVNDALEGVKLTIMKPHPTGGTALAVPGTKVPEEALDVTGFEKMFQRARERYKIGAGIRQFFEETGSLEPSPKGAIYDPEKAMRGLQGAYHKVLARRGMGEDVQGIVAPGPPGTTVEKGAFGIPLWTPMTEGLHVKAYPKVPFGTAPRSTLTTPQKVITDIGPVGPGILAEEALEGRMIGGKRKKQQE